MKIISNVLEVIEGLNLSCQKKKQQQQKQKEGYEKEREFVSTEDFFISEQAMQVNNAL